DTVSIAALEEGDQDKFEKLLKGENFAKLYAWAIEKVTPASQEVLTSTKGEWIKYDQGSGHMPLVESLQGHGTGWCTAGESTAEIQLRTGDFYTYYSFDEDGKPTIPRAAIRMEEGRIAEVRGVGEEQNLDPYIGEVVQKKLKEFPDGAAYEKKASDMKCLTEIERKVNAGTDLSKDDLAFLYEIKTPIEGFGYERDPRIVELRENRDPEADLPIVFECEPEQIARSMDQISENTKAYVGPLEPGIFQKIAQFNVEHIYTSFPERRIQRQAMEVGGKTREELFFELKDKGVNISSYAEAIMEHSDFVTSNEVEEMDFIRLSVLDLDIKGTPNTDAVYARAQELGLELVPSEAGPHYRLQTMDQAMGDWAYMGMKQITGPDGRPFVFDVGRREDGLWLYGRWAPPGRQWSPGSKFVFRLRKSES
ncbi:MAG: hypothetical protein QF745_01445, partial [Planctomycetota bacterium]|nr:hypothetical protein [Planctomycetota bacterium]